MGCAGKNTKKTVGNPVLTDFFLHKDGRGRKKTRARAGFSSAPVRVSRALYDPKKNPAGIPAGFFFMETSSGHLLFPPFVPGRGRRYLSGST